MEGRPLGGFAVGFGTADPPNGNTLLAGLNSLLGPEVGIAGKGTALTGAGTEATMLCLDMPVPATEPTL